MSEMNQEVCVLTHQYHQAWSEGRTVYIGDVYNILFQTLRIKYSLLASDVENIYQKILLVTRGLMDYDNDQTFVVQQR